MDFVEKLQKRVWPKRPEKVNIGDYHTRVFVRDGHVETRALQMHQNLSQPIPAGECAITSLCKAGGGLIFGATSGKRAHLFCYNPGPGEDGVTDLGVPENAKEVRRALVSTGDGRVIGGVTVAENCEPGGYLFAYPRRSKEGAGLVERLATPVKNEGVTALAIDRTSQRVYGISTVTGTFFFYDIAKGAVVIKGPVDETNTFSNVLVLDKKGNVYGTKSSGELFKYDPEQDLLVSLKLSIPSVAGHQFYNQMDSAVLDEQSGLIYGAGSADGVIFVFDPANLKIITLGKVTAEPRVRCMTAGLDGKIYGISGTKDGMGHLFRYDPETRELADLGILYSGMDRVWHGYEFDAACTGEFGEIYLGESDRISHLFIYFPPVRRFQV